MPAAPQPGSAAWPNAEQIRAPGLGKERGKANRPPCLHRHPPSWSWSEAQLPASRELGASGSHQGFIFPSMALAAVMLSPTQGQQPPDTGGLQGLFSSPTRLALQSWGALGCCQAPAALPAKHPRGLPSLPPAPIWCYLMYPMSRAGFGVWGGMGGWRRQVAALRAKGHHRSLRSSSCCGFTPMK